MKFSTQAPFTSLSIRTHTLIHGLKKYVRDIVKMCYKLFIMNPRCTVAMGESTNKHSTIHTPFLIGQFFLWQTPARLMWNREGIWGSVPIVISLWPRIASNPSVLGYTNHRQQGYNNLHYLYLCQTTDRQMEAKGETFIVLSTFFFSLVRILGHHLRHGSWLLRPLAISPC